MASQQLKQMNELHASMRNEMRTLLAATAFAVVGMARAQAADIAPTTGHWTKLGADCSALV
jgi:hypothetical protein